MMDQKRGIFITFEGGEGGGKTSQIPPLVEYLRQKGFTVYPTREPGGTSIGEQIRNVIKSPDNKEMHPRTETLLFQAARAQIVEEEIKPRLKRGEIVICDRFFYSTLAYQGYGHRQDLGTLRYLIDYATGGLEPDLVVLLDIDPEVGLKRKEEQKEWNRLDGYDLEFHKRVRQGFLAMAKDDPKRWVVIDAGRPVDEVKEELLKEVERKLIEAGIIEGV